MDLKFELEIATHLAKEAGNEIIRCYDDFEKHIESKADGSPVTLADKLANQIILNGLRKFFPDDGIVSEELAKVDGKRMWYVDPIDGTRSFITRSDQFAVHIGLSVDGKPDLGVVYKPLSRELYYAVRGEGAFRMTRNGYLVKLSIDSLIKHEALEMVVTSNFDELARSASLREKLNAKFLLCGSEGLRLMKLAENIGDVYFSKFPHRGNTWDTCAPHAILEEAGGLMRFADGSEMIYAGQGRWVEPYIAARTNDYFSKMQKPVQELVSKSN